MYVSHGWITLRPCRPGTRLRGCDGGQSSYKRVKGRTESVGWRSEDAGLVGGQGSIRDVPRQERCYCVGKAQKVTEPGVVAPASKRPGWYHHWTDGRMC